MNTGVAWPIDSTEAWARVLRMQTKLHRWAVAEPGRRFDDVFNLVYDPAFLAAAWDRVRTNTGARTAGVDQIAPRSITSARARTMLVDLREAVKTGRFVPDRVRQKSIPKAGGKIRWLGIPTMADRIVQASLKLVLEPIFEADFQPSSYGFRPRRRAQDAIAEIHYLGSATRDYGWVFEADITACFDEIDHAALMERVRGRISDRHVLGLVKAFLKAGVLTEDGLNRDTRTGTPQGGILSPLLANIALSILDEHFHAKWEALGPEWTRVKHRRAGGPVMKLVRYADDFVIMVHGQRSDAEALWGEVATVLQPMGLRLSEAKTRLTHIDDGFDFLGWRIQRRRKKGHQAGKRYVYTYPSKKSLASILDKVRQLTRRASHRTLADLLRRLNPVIRGWCAYFSPRRVETHLQLPRPLRLLADRRLAEETTPRHWDAHPGPAPPPRLEDPRRRDRVLPRLAGSGDPLPLPRNPYPHTLGERHGVILWRAGCPGMGTSGSQGGQQKPTNRKAGRALLSDPYTEHRTGEGKLYLCAVKDVFSGRIVGYSIADRMKARLAVDAVASAVARRGVDGATVAGCVVHSDRGSQFRSRKVPRRTPPPRPARIHGKGRRGR